MMKIALITGASSGLGREFARQIPKLYQNLDEIWVVARRAERLNELEMELKVPPLLFFTFFEFLQFCFLFTPGMSDLIFLGLINILCRI